MGWSTYPGMTARQAVEHELRGMDILAVSGAWYLVRTNNPASVFHGHVTLVHALVERHGGEVAIKLVDASMGPNGTPPKSLFRRWLRESDGQIRGDYERDFIQRVEEGFAKLDAAKTLKAGDTFRFEHEVKFSDGVTETEFVYEGKFRARRKTDNALIRLPRNFRSRIANEMMV